MTSFAGWGFINSSSSMFAQYGMGIVLNSFFGTILSAAQGVANQISGQLMVFFTYYANGNQPYYWEKGRQ